MWLHSSLSNQHRPGTSEKSIAGKQITQPLPEKTWKGKWYVLADGVCSPPHWCSYLPTARAESLRALSLWNPLKVFIYVMHSRVFWDYIFLRSRFLNSPFSPASKELSPHTHINAIRVQISLQREQMQPFFGPPQRITRRYLVRRSFLRPFQAPVGPDGRPN